MSLLLLLSALSWGLDQGWAESQQCDGSRRSTYSEGVMRSMSNCDREAAAARAAATRNAAPQRFVPLAVPAQGGVPDYFGIYPNYANSPLPKGPVLSVTLVTGGSGYSATPTVTISDAYNTGAGATATATVVGGIITGITLGTPGSNYTVPVVTITDVTGTGASATATITGGTAYIGGIRKFVDALPNLTIAVPDTITYPGNDYYEIRLREYAQKMHSDLPPTKLRGYVQTNNGTDAMGNNTVAPPVISYLGPVIVAQRDRPVRVKFINELPTGASGNLFIPVDTTYMGAGMGPDGMNSYTQNRATVHLHGGTTTWISDGTPHQWTTPAGENTPYPEGVSVYNVPDMDGGTEPQGTLTFFYTNQQSARLMFFHDHAYGITRLNVYAGEAAGYLLTDTIEQTLINGGTIIPPVGTPVNVSPGTIPYDVNFPLGIPLIIQDKTFVDAATILSQDPTWNWGSLPPVSGIVPPNTGDLWFPHVYMPNQNPFDISGANPMGRWDYGPWFWPPFTGLQYGPIPNPYYNPACVPSATTYCEPPQIPGTPEARGFSPSGVPESFMDTPIVNGMAYPYLVVDPKAYRFRILNVANDRYLNLSLFVADPDVITPIQIPCDVTFNDVFAGFSAENYIKAIYCAGITAGCTVNPLNFCPTNPVTRAQAAAFIIRAKYGENFAYSAAPHFTDVLQTNPLFKYIQKMFEDGITTGYSDGTYRPSVVVNRAQASAFIIRAKFGENFPYTLTAYFTDVLNTNGFFKYIQKMKDMGYTTGCTATQFCPNDDVSRANAAVFIARAFLGGQANTEVKMVPFTPNQNAISAFPAWWYDPAISGSLDGRTGGVPDPLTRGPAMIQIGTEGGFLPAPAVIKNQPVNYDYNRRSITVLNVLQKALFLGPAERADIIVDFTNFAGKTLILYNDGPAPVPGFDSRLDYYTGDPDQTDTGGAPTTLPGYGPNTRTIMQIRVNGTGGLAPVDDYNAAALTALQTAIPAAFAASQDTIIVPQAPYNAVYNGTFPGNASAYVKIQDTSFTFTPIGQTTPLLMDLQPKSIIEDFQMDYGRMNAILGNEIPHTNITNQTSIMQAYKDPPVEIVRISDKATPIGALDDGTQLWKFTHNGVDTHAIHFHLFNVQLINRVGWDGSIRPPDANELGWKDTVRMNPLEDAVVALRPIKLDIPFKLPNSIRPIDPTMPLHTSTQFTGVDPNGNPVTIMNELTNFGWEYVYHCHLLGHEENDMMRPMVVAVPPDAPSGLNATGGAGPIRVDLSWADNSLNETSFIIQRATDAGFTLGLTIFTVPENSTGYSDTTVVQGQTYYYRVVASNTVGYTATATGYPTMRVDSSFSNTAVVTP